MSTEQAPPATILINLSEPLKESVDPTLYVRGDLFDSARDALREIARLTEDSGPPDRRMAFLNSIAEKALVDIDEKD